jgi:GMP synthase (glutamine-hydrolysing)
MSLLSKQILIIKAGSKLPSLESYAGDFEHWIMRGMGREEHEFKILQPALSASYPVIEQIKGIVITGSGAMVTEHSEWIERCAKWLHGVSQLAIPILGICFGHQLLAYALGGRVDDNPAGVEVGTKGLQVMPAAKDDYLFSGLSELAVQTSHKQSVLDLPAEAVCLATTAMDSHHAFRYQQCVWGVQFHPEFNAEITQHYIHYYAAKNLLDVEEDLLIKTCQETQQAASLLKRFSKLIGA